MQGWLTVFCMFASICPILLYSGLSDIKGRRIVLNIVVTGGCVAQLLTMPTFLFWERIGIWGISHIIILILVTGGPQLVTSTIYAMLFDSVIESDRGTWLIRSLGIYYLICSIGSLLGPWLMTVRLLLPLYIATGILMLRSCLLLTIPETLPPKQRILPAKSLVCSVSQHIIQSFRILRRTRNLSLIALGVFSHAFGSQIFSMLAIYINLWHGWSVIVASYMYSYQGFMIFVTIALLGPCAKSLNARLWQSSEQNFDVIVTKLSFGVATLAWAAIAILPAQYMFPAIGIGAIGRGTILLVGPSAMAISSEESYSKYFAILAIVHALGSGVAGLYSVTILGKPSSTRPESVFLPIAGISGLSCLCLCIWFTRPILSVHEVYYEAMLPDAEAEQES